MTLDAEKILKYHGGDRGKAVTALQSGIDSMIADISPEKSAVAWNLALREAIQKNRRIIQELEILG